MYVVLWLVCLLVCVCVFTCSYAVYEREGQLLAAQTETQSQTDILENPELEFPLTNTSTFIASLE